MPPIFTATQFAGVQPRRPFIGYPGRPIQVIPDLNDPVTIQLSDNQVITVFDTKDTALRCMEQMRLNGQWLLTPTDEVMIISVSYVKLLIAESSLINQKLFASYLPVYFGGLTRFVHRSMSIVHRLADALQDVGFFVQGPLVNQYDLTNSPGKPYMSLCDVNYQAALTVDQVGSKLDDLQFALLYNYVDNPVEEVVV